MTRVELRAGASLAGVFGLRMLGLFFILPVLAVHAPGIEGGDNLTLVGVALGAYGLSQGILQIPFGAASDRWGRKPVLYAGLLIFAAGSFLGCVADDIWTMIAARTLQGAGAISSVAMALAADLTREQHRTKVMAMIGSMIGFMFALSLVGAPLLYRAIGMEGLFALTGVLCLAAIAVVKFQVPDPPAQPRAAAPAGSVRAAVLDAELAATERRHLHPARGAVRDVPGGAAAAGALRARAAGALEAVPAGGSRFLRAHDSRRPVRRPPEQREAGADRRGRPLVRGTGCVRSARRRGHRYRRC